MPATRTLKTDWKRIGRSGPTVDGRTISPQMLLDAAETYDKDTFTALIWPDHFHWINYGLVEELKAEKNKEGGVDLFAILSPNQMYLQSNSMGQRLFLSMELLPDFAETGKTYLTGLAATDDPASLGTSEMRFSADSKKVGVLFSQSTEIDLTGKADKDDEDSFFRRLSAFFKSNSIEDEDMADKAELEKLKKELADLSAAFSKLKPEDKKPDEKPEDPLVTLSKQVEALTQKFDTLSKQVDDKTKQTQEDEAAKTTEEIITKLTKQVEDLSTKLSKALDEQPGTPGGTDGGDGEFSDKGKFADIY